jgi:hypothetical protein
MYTDLWRRVCYQSEQADLLKIFFSRLKVSHPAILFKDDVVTYSLQFVLILYQNGPL